MRVRSLRLSNVLTFGYAADINKATSVEFDIGGDKGSLHILIGPNGAGKSNFIQILTGIFRGALFRRAFFNELNAQRHPYTTIDNPVVGVRGDGFIPHFVANRYVSGRASSLVLVLSLDQSDFDNLRTLIDNRDPLNQLILKFSSHTYIDQETFEPKQSRVPAADSLYIPNADPDRVSGYSEVRLRFDRDPNFYHRSNYFLSWEDNLASPELELIKHYLLNFEFLQELTAYYAAHSENAGIGPWPTLINTFALIGPYRDYHSFADSITVEHTSIATEPMYTGLGASFTTRVVKPKKDAEPREPAVFEFLKDKIARQFLNLLSEETLTRDSVKETIKEKDPYRRLNKALKEYLGLSLEVHKPRVFDSVIAFHLEHVPSHTKIGIDDLSTGEKAFAHLLFFLYGLGLRNGLVLIDEPELHLHPQLQKQLLRLIDEMKDEFAIQFVLATQSPMFVDHHTIKDVSRFYLSERHNTKVAHPNLSSPQTILARILDYTNSAKIFFVKRVILVEGESDEYFYRVYLNRLKEHAPSTGLQTWKAGVSNFEILNIQGKGQRKSWTEFLASFGVDVYFIGDWDNVGDIADFEMTAFLNQYRSAQQQANEAIAKKGSTDGRNLFAKIDAVVTGPTDANISALAETKEYIVNRLVDYSAVVDFIKTEDRDGWTKLERAIEASYQDRIFILKRGELENYLGLEGRPKRLESIIQFCEETLDSWEQDKVYVQHRTELESIFQMIFTSV